MQRKQRLIAKIEEASESTLLKLEQLFVQIEQDNDGDSMTCKGTKRPRVELRPVASILEVNQDVLSSHLFPFLCLSDHACLGVTSWKMTQISGLSVSNQIYSQPSAWKKWVKFPRSIPLSFFPRIPIQYLDLVGVRIASGELMALKNASIVKLRLSGTTICSEDIGGLKDMPIRHLDLGTCSGLAGMGPYISSLTRLEVLILALSNVDNESIRRLPQSITHLDLTCCRCIDQDSVFDLLGVRPKLKTLKLRGTRLQSPLGLDAAHFPSLLYLDLFATAINDDVVKGMVGMNLASLDLGFCTSLTNKALISLQSMCLKYVNLRGSGISGYAVSEFSCLQHIVPEVIFASFPSYQIGWREGSENKNLRNADEILGSLTGR